MHCLGVADVLTVLDAERTLLSAQEQLADRDTRTATALVGVYTALGGGWGHRAGNGPLEGALSALSMRLAAPLMPHGTNGLAGCHGCVSYVAPRVRFRMR